MNPLNSHYSTTTSSVDSITGKDDLAEKRVVRRCVVALVMVFPAQLYVILMIDVYIRSIVGESVGI